MEVRNRRSPARATLAIATLLMLMLTACSRTQNAQGPASATQTVAPPSTTEHVDEQPPAAAADGASIEMPHIHGLGFSPDGHRLMVPAHDGLRVYAGGKWSIPDAPAHDYMGFVPSDDGFYSSGHPHPASGLVNPFGLIKSTDEGETLVKLGFEGESDFHFMAVGYHNHAIYVVNPAPNSRLQPGIHYSLDDGQTWQQSALQGVTAQPIQMAVHPVDANVVALATEAGVLLSTDYGDSFAPIADGGLATAVAFHPNGDTLLFGYQALSAYDLASQQVTALSAPTIAADDAIGYIVVNPVRTDEVAVATFSRDIHFSQDGGKTWTSIAEDGVTR